MVEFEFLSRIVATDCLVWFGLVWFGLVWFGLVWFGLVGHANISQRIDNRCRIPVQNNTVFPSDVNQLDIYSMLLTQRLCLDDGVLENSHDCITMSAPRPE